MYQRLFHKTKVISGRMADAIPKKRQESIVLCGFKGFLFSLGFGFVFCFALAGIFYSTKDPSAYIEPAAYCLLLLSSLMGGFFAAKIRGGSFLLCGLCCSVMFLIFVFLLSLAFPSQESKTSSLAFSMGMRGLCVLFSVLGGGISCYKRHKTPYRLKRKK